MNIRRGLMRLWVLFAVVWTIGAGLFQFLALKEAAEARTKLMTVWDAVAALGWVVLPPVLALAVIPLVVWTVKGFGPHNRTYS